MAWVMPVIAGIQALYGAYSGNKARQQAHDQSKTAVDAQNKQLGLLQPYGQQQLQQGQGNLDIVQQYLRQLASGDRNLTQQTLAPEINSMAGAQRGSVSAQQSLYPRGGMAPSQASQLPQQLQGNINNLMFSARPQAMSQLGQLGSNQSSLGLGALGQGAGLTNSMLDYGLQSRQQLYNVGAGVMGGVGNSLMNAYLMYQMNKPAPTQTQSNLPITNSYSPNNGYFGMLTPGTGAGGGSAGNNTTPPSNSSYSNYQPTPSNPYGQP